MPVPCKHHIGERFGKLVVLSEEPRSSAGYRIVTCKCDCGTVKSFALKSLTGRGTHSCGCGRAEFNRTHGLSKKSPEYFVWIVMRQRCNNPNDRGYHNYGARGIKVCSEWDSFEQFIEDMGYLPSDKHSLEREDNDGPYSAENCVWAVRKVQANNTRSNRMIEFAGRCQSLKLWSDELGIKYDVLRSRLDRGQSIEKAFTSARQSRRQLTTVQANQIRRLWAEGLNRQVIAEQFGIDYRTVWKIGVGKAYAGDGPERLIVEASPV